MTPEEVPANWQDREPGHYDPASDSERGLILSEQGLLDTRRKATEMLTDFYVHDNAKIILVLLDALEAAGTALDVQLLEFALDLHTTHRASFHDDPGGCNLPDCGERIAAEYARLAGVGSAGTDSSAATAGEGT